MRAGPGIPPFPQLPPSLLSEATLSEALLVTRCAEGMREKGGKGKEGPRVGDTIVSRWY